MFGNKFVKLIFLFCLFTGFVFSQISESFESGLPTAYNATLTNATLGSGTWRIADVIAGTTGVQSGTKSAQLRSAAGSQIITPQFSGGVGDISFYVRGSTTSGSYVVNVSSDNGTTWSAVSGSPFSISTTTTLRTITVNSASIDKIQIVRAAATITIDDFATTIYTPTCTTPTTQASSFSSNTITATSMNIAFTRGNGVGGVLVVARAAGAVNADPSSGTTYTANSTFGSGTQIGTGNYVVYNGTANGTGVASGNIPIFGLASNTTYHFAIYEYNTTGICFNVTELVGNATTICAAATEPTTQATGISTSSITCNSATISFTRSTTASNSIVVVSTDNCSGASFSNPVDQSAYTANSAFGAGAASTLVGVNDQIVYSGTGGSVTVTGLTSGVTYFYRIYSYNGTTANCTENYLNGGSCNSFTPGPSAEPTTQATAISSTVLCTSATINFTRSTTATNSIVVVSTDDCAGVNFSNPADQTAYAANTVYASGGASTLVGSNDQVVYNGTGNSVSVSGLVAGTTYYYRVYSYNGTSANCAENYLLAPSCNTFTTNTGCVSTSDCIVISEFCIDPKDAMNGGTAGDNGEWIEIKNTCASSVDIGCFVLCATCANANSSATDRQGECYTIPSGTTLAGGDVYVLGGSGTTPLAPVDFNWHSSYSSVWNVATNAFCTSTSGVGVINDGGGTGRGEDLTLFDNSGTLLVGVTFGNTGLWSSSNTETISATGGCASLAITIPASSSHLNVGSTPASGSTTDEGFQMNCDGVWSYNPEATQTMGSDPEGICPVILPIELSSFNANCNIQGSIVNWTTESESNNNYFTIEHSQYGDNFKALKTVNGAGSSSNTVNYSTTISEKSGYLRLKQTDFNGKSTYSDAIAINCDVDDLIVYPNPSNGLITIKFHSAEQVLVYDQIGKLIREYPAFKESIQINLNDLSTGVYHLNIVSNDRNLYKKIEIKK